MPLRTKVGLDRTRIIITGAAPCPAYLLEFLRVAIGASSFLIVFLVVCTNLILGSLALPCVIRRASGSGLRHDGDVGGDVDHAADRSERRSLRSAAALQRSSPQVSVLCISFQRMICSAAQRCA